MKLSRALSLSVVGLLSSQAQGCTLNFEFEGSCSLESFQQASGCTAAQLVNLLKVRNSAAVSELIQEECQEAKSKRASTALSWKKVALRGQQFDDEFFDGGGIFNNEDGQDVTRYAVEAHPDTQRIVDISDRLLTSHGIHWPHDIKNFSKEGSCESEIAMCCWTANRNTNAFVENAEVCSHDIYNSKGSAHVADGSSVFGEGSNARCHGFLLSKEDTYDGNLLFKVAMEEGLLKGYVKNIPSAPMCACLEQMPAVTQAACTSIEEVVETWQSTFDDSIDAFYITPKGDVSITFGNCNGQDLLTYATPKLDTDFNADLRLKGDKCGADTTQQLEDLAFRKRSDVDVEWVPVAGKGLYYHPSLNEEEFRDIWTKSKNQILRRRCSTCAVTHQDIYYRRFDAEGLPEDLELLHVVKNYWYTDPYVPSNVFNQNFKLYSTYEDALQDEKAWRYCNFNSKTGFPRDCGPYGKIDNQWNTFQPYDGGRDGQYHVAFYVEYGGGEGVNPLMAPSSMPSSAPTYPGYGQYELVYDLDIPVSPSYDNGPPVYNYDDSDNTESFARILYRLELDDKYVAVSMDAFTVDRKEIGVPVENVFQQMLTNVSIESNVPGLSGSGLSGNIEFWPYDYGASNTKGVPGASNRVYDFGDERRSSGNYGSMQIHINGGGDFKGTVFAFNRFNRVNSKADIGIGNKPSGNPDWTFAQNSGSYDIRNLRVFTLPGPNPLMAPSSMPSSAPTYPTLGQYELVYDLDIPVSPSYDNGPPAYKYDNSGNTLPFSRILYRLDLDDKYVIVSMDAFTRERKEIGVPLNSVFQQMLTNVSVESNVPGLSGSGLSGNIEFWPTNYSASNEKSIPGASSRVFDYGDARSSSGNYGSMQIHINGGGDYTGTVFAFNRFRRVNDAADIGIGNKPSGNPDWTFSENTRSYQVRSLKIYTLPLIMD